MKRLRMRLNANFSGPQSWLLLAVQRGYVAEAGVELAFTEGNGAYNTAPAMLEGDFDLGYGDLYALVELAAAEPVRAPTCVFAVFNASPSAIAVPIDSPIYTPADLIGRRIVGHEHDVGLRTFGAFAGACGLDPASVRIETVDVPMASIVDHLNSDRGPHGMFGYVSTITAALAATGVDANTRLRWLRYDTLAPFLYGSGVMAAPWLIADEPDLIRRLLVALSRGITEAIVDPDAAIAAVLAFNSRANPVVEMTRWRVTREIEMDHLDGRTIGFGSVDPIRFADGIRRHATAIGLDPLPSLERIYTPAFLPGLESRAFPACVRSATGVPV